MKELEIIDRIRKAFPEGPIGDDAAVLPAPRGDLLFASDAIVENVHFRRRFSTLSQAVQKLVTSNVSDIHAMGGAPRAVTLTAGLPPGCTAGDVDELVDGLATACGHYGIVPAGGDTVLSPGGFFFDVAITGEAPPGRALRRSGARAGDALVLFGEIGPSLAGLAALSALADPGCGGAYPAPRIRDCAALGPRLRGVLPELGIATSEAELRAKAGGFAHVPHAGELLRFIKHHLVPIASPLEGSLLGGAESPVTALIDVSDGVAKDLRTLCDESGVGAVVQAGRLPIPAALGAIFELDGDRLVDFALSSGEEYVLLAAVREAALGALPAGAAVIGSIVPRTGGIAVEGPGGARELPPIGYEHAF